MIMNRVSMQHLDFKYINNTYIYMYVCYSISIYTSMQSVCYPIRWVNVLQPKNNIPFSRCLVCHHRIYSDSLLIPLSKVNSYHKINTIIKQ